MMHIFINWNESRRINPIGEYGVPILISWRKYHLPTFWLKYVIINLLKNSTNLDKNQLEGLLARSTDNNKVGYERHLVQLILYSLQETTHGRFIKKDYKDNHSTAKLKLTERGEQFVNECVSFNFIYLSLVCKDSALALPDCFKYTGWCKDQTR